VVFNDESISFSQGKGYMEKDWGHSFPEALNQFKYSNSLL